MKILLIVTSLFLSSVAMAADSPKQLARRSLEFINRGEILLMELVEDRDQQAYNDELWSPTVALHRSWSAMEDMSAGKFRFCQFALDAFRNYADATFKNGKRLRSSSLPLREYLKEKSRCEAAVAGKSIPEFD